MGVYRLFIEYSLLLCNIKYYLQRALQMGCRIFAWFGEPTSCNSFNVISFLVLDVSMTLFIILYTSRFVFYNKSDTANKSMVIGVFRIKRKKHGRKSMCGQKFAPNIIPIKNCWNLLIGYKRQIVVKH